VIKLNLGRTGTFDIKTPTVLEIVALAVVLLFLLSIAYIVR
jgi:hypothetical protein